MRIALPVWEFRPTGGIERSVTEVVRWLLDRGHQVDVLTARDSSTLGHEGLRVVRLRVPRFSLLRSLSEVPPFVAAASLYLRRNRRCYDVVINYGVGQSLVQDVLVATSCHAAWVQARRHLALRGMGNPLNHFILSVERHNYIKARQGSIVAVSRQVAAQLRDFYDVEPDEVTIVYPGVDVEEFTPTGHEEARLQVLNEFKLPAHASLLLYCGQEHLRKGLDVLIQALPSITNRDAHLLVVGHDPAWEDYMRGMARELGVASRVHFAGSRHDVARYFRAADLFVFPTRMDAFGMVVLEGMASGLPVVVSPAAGASELIRSWENGVVLNRADDPGEIASVVDRLLGDSGLRMAIGESARQTALRHTWARHAQAILEVGERLIRQRNVGRTMRR